ncbi:hypothetical protein GJ496_004259 [Pomphorhynchus laevis]|nr:hypothetical protein GJ496_004259 [Pomphorhynchus laevis]
MVQFSRTYEHNVYSEKGGDTRAAKICVLGCNVHEVRNRRRRDVGQRRQKGNRFLDLGQKVIKHICNDIRAKTFFTSTYKLINSQRKRGMYQKNLLREQT